MAIATVAEIFRIDRPQVRAYAEGDPHGFAYSHVEVTGDASGGFITVALNASPGFVYRLEFAQVVIGDELGANLFLQLQHRYLGDAIPIANNSGRTIAAFRVQAATPTGFRVFGLDDRITPVEVLRRLPLGDLRNRTITTLVASWTIEINTNTVVYEMKLLLTFWRKDAMTRPGFWAAFNESPAPRFPAILAP